MRVKFSEKFRVELWPLIAEGSPAANPLPVGCPPRPREISTTLRGNHHSPLLVVDTVNLHRYVRRPVLFKSLGEPRKKDIFIIIHESVK